MALTVSLDEIIGGGNPLLGIKPHWSRIRLGDIGEVLNGFAFKAELFTREGGMPLIRIRDVGRDASETFYSGEFDERYVVNVGDLLVGMDGDFNCARWRGPRSLLNQRVCKIKVDESVYLPRFLDYVLPGYLKAINDVTSSVTVKHLSSRTIQDIPLPLPPMEEQREIVAELEKQFSRLDEAVTNLQRVKANLKRYERATITSLTNPESFDACVSGTVADVAISLDNMRKPVNKLERAKRLGNIPYLGANGQTGWIDEPLFNEELVLVVEDETFVGRTDPFCYYFADPCWVNNHTHVLRARPEVVYAKYLNLALSYYPFIPLTTGSTGRRKLTKAALMSAPISVPSLKKQTELIDEVERCLSIAREVEAEVDTNLKRAHALRQVFLATAFSSGKK